MRFLLFFSLLQLCAACSNAGLIFVNGLARFDNYELTANLKYGDHESNRLDIYQPARPAEATIIFFYGGCWGACTSYGREEYRFVGQALTSLGYQVVIPDYRLYPDVLFPQIMQDSTDVVDWVDNNIGRYGGVSDRIFLMGHSAGGHIAAMLAVNENYLDPERRQNIKGYIGLAAPYDFIFDKPYLRKLFAGMDYAESQPVNFINGNEPPLLLLYGSEDRTVYPRNIINMTQAVKSKGGRVEAYTFDGVGHVDILAALSIPYRDNFPVMRTIAAFLEKNRD